MSLTDAEHRAMQITADLYNLLAAEVVGNGMTRDADLAELSGHIHGVQHMILAQSAAREHPDRYRLLGEVNFTAADLGRLSWPGRPSSQAGVPGDRP